MIGFAIEGPGSVGCISSAGSSAIEVVLDGVSIACRQRIRTWWQVCVLETSGGDLVTWYRRLTPLGRGPQRVEAAAESGPARCSCGTVQEESCLGLIHLRWLQVAVNRPAVAIRIL